MNRKSIAERARIIQLLVEGNSLRSTARIRECSINTVMKLLGEVGAKCASYQDEKLRGLSCKYIQVDEIWSFVHTKNHRLHDNSPKNSGDCWTWTAIDPDTKLMVSWMVGLRDRETGELFMEDLAKRLVTVPQITSDGFRYYSEAVEKAFGKDVKFGVLNKLYEKTKAGNNGRYKGSEKLQKKGNPDPAKITTAHVERSNLTMRMCIRRFGRRTNAFSKKIENHSAAISLHFMYYNFCRIHKTLRITPAMAAGLTERVWDIEDLVTL